MAAACASALGPRQGEGAQELGAVCARGAASLGKGDRGKQGSWGLVHVRYPRASMKTHSHIDFLDTHITLSGKSARTLT